MSTSILAPVASLVAGGVLASASVVGLVTTLTSAPSESPANVEAPEYNYGTTE